MSNIYFKKLPVQYCTCFFFHFFIFFIEEVPGTNRQIYFGVESKGKISLVGVSQLVDSATTSKKNAAVHEGAVENCSILRRSRTKSFRCKVGLRIQGDKCTFDQRHNLPANSILFATYMIPLVWRPRVTRVWVVPVWCEETLHFTAEPWTITGVYCT